MPSNFVPSSLHTLAKRRYEKPFELLRYDLGGQEGVPTLASGVGFLEGTVVVLNDSNQAIIAPSGKGDYFAVQTVKDLSSFDGRRNMNNTNVHLGETINIQTGVGLCATKIHEGSGDIGDYAWWDGSTLQFDAAGAVPSGVKILGRLKHADGPDLTAVVNGTAGDSTTVSSVKALVNFNINLIDEELYG